MYDSVRTLKSKLKEHGLKYAWLYGRLRDCGYGDFSVSGMGKVLSEQRAVGSYDVYINKGLELVREYEDKINS